MIESERKLLRVLNSAPVIGGRIVETLDDPATARLRDDLHGVIRGDREATELDPYLAGLRRRPRLTVGGVEWELEGAPDALPLAEIVLEWARLQREAPGRLRPCANPECNKFLIDHSKPNSARWCSMAECGNRMKARRHYARLSA